MRILSLETATYSGGVAFINGDSRETAGPFESRAASREVLAAANDLLLAHGCGPRDLDLVAVSTGPGLFTGVRVGLAIAKTLVWACGPDRAPSLIGVPTLDAVAPMALDRGDQEEHFVAAVTDARRGEVYAALFSVENNRALRRLGPDIVVRPERLAERLLGNREMGDRPLWLVGDGADRYRTLLEENLGAQARFAPQDEGAGLALRIADLAVHHLKESGPHTPFELQPHYVRRPDARLPVILGH
ncbi:tRNA (adenosine(37)-N6)-threonylcarbamoyltransferase complex dimerization subunit type 1 TsaB [bacterium]|nr:tRNA (adenosine(37)-N6)-threonylcarbamoyltransferase complex dimerization subunit type 1 TsaB [bacterium]